MREALRTWPAIGTTNNEHIANNRSDDRAMIIQYGTMKPAKAQLPSRSLSLPYRRNAVTHIESAT